MPGRGLCLAWRSIACRSLVCLVFAWTLFVLPGRILGQERGETQLDVASIRQAAAKLKQSVTEAAQHGGGDLRNEHVSLVLAFSTGHFSRDPLRAQAAREVAHLLLRDLPVVQDDKVSVFAFEMETWPFSTEAGKPYAIGADAVREAKAIYRQLPLTPRPGSAGGHDTERAITEVAEILSAKGADLRLISSWCCWPTMLAAWILEARKPASWGRAAQSTSARLTACKPSGSRPSTSRARVWSCHSRSFGQTASGWSGSFMPSLLGLSASRQRSWRNLRGKSSSRLRS